MRKQETQYDKYAFSPGNWNRGRSYRRLDVYASMTGWLKAALEEASGPLYVPGDLFCLDGKKMSLKVPLRIGFRVTQEKHLWSIVEQGMHGFKFPVSVWMRSKTAIPLLCMDYASIDFINATKEPIWLYDNQTIILSSWMLNHISKINNANE